jgi:hypothetical protein
MVAIAEARSTVERLTLAELCRRVPGTSRQVWIRALLPQLVAGGALVKRGRAWFGRWNDVERVLLTPSESNEGA